MIAMFAHKCLAHDCPGKWSATAAETHCRYCGSDNILCWKAR